MRITIQSSIAVNVGDRGIEVLAKTTSHAEETVDNPRTGTGSGVVLVLEEVFYIKRAVEAVAALFGAGHLYVDFLCWILLRYCLPSSTLSTSGILP